MSMSTLVVMPSRIVGDGSLRGIALSNQDCAGHFICHLFLKTNSPSYYFLRANYSQLVLPSTDQPYDLSTIITEIAKTPLSTYTRIILRNYIEVGNIFLTDHYRLAFLNYAVLGDTHHISCSLEWSLQVLLSVRPSIFFSRSNPHHSLLLGNILRNLYELDIHFAAAPDYLLIDSNNCQSTTVSGPYSALMCISNLSVQVGRLRLLKKLVKKF